MVNNKRMKIFDRINGGIMLILLCTFFAGCTNTQGGSEMDKGYISISMDEVNDYMENTQNYIILDVRTQEEYDSGHIPGAICIPNETIEGKEPTELPDKEQYIFVYCRSGNRSRQAAEKLVELGYENIVEFGGIIDWDGEIE